MKKLLPFILTLMVTSATLLPHIVVAQAPEVRTAVKSDVSIPFRDMVPIKESLLDKLFKSKESEREVPNRFHVKPMINPELIIEADGAIQEKNLLKSTMAITPTIVNFDGLNNSNNTGGRVTPPDPAGDVGPNHYVQAVNCMLRVFSKSGASLYGPVTTATIWSGFSGNWTGHNDGDAVVMYDEQADRWIISQFAVDCAKVGGLYTEYELVAVSTTPDPTGSYYRYAFQFDYMPDYPKLGVWQDGYYLAVNRFNTNSSGSFVGAGACVLDRTKMLAGDPAASMIYFKCETLNTSSASTSSDYGPACYSMLPGDCDGTPAAAGTPNYFTYINDNSWGGNDELRIWALKPNWTSPASSTMTFSTVLPVASFSLFSTGTDIVQKGTTLKLDCLDDRLMYRTQYRNMGTYESMVACHSVNTGSNVGGVRWYEMRKSGSTWALYQQGTYTLSDTKSRWLGSVAMNAAGDIALGFTVSNSSTYPSIYFTGRKASDALGTMTFTESPIVDGAYSMTGTATRWGDYAMMSVDPTDNLTFWHTNEYIYSGTGTWPWGTKIASFKLSSSTAPVVTTLAATSVTGTSAILNGTVNPGGIATTYYFDYGTTTSYGSSTTSTSAGTGTAVVAVNATISSLVAGTTYHFRLVATNTGGTTNGSDLTFTPGQAVLTTVATSTISANSGTAGGTITSDGGSVITARGVCWGTASGATIAGTHTTDGSGTGTFASSLTGLADNTLYYYRAYATNGGGTYYGNELTFTTSSVAAPVAIAATNTGTSGFTSNWNASTGAQSYKLDVSTTSTFTSGGTGSLTEGFSNGITAPSGWTFTSITATYTSSGNYGASSPSLRMDGTGDRILTPTLSSAATSLSFWIKGQQAAAANALLVEGYNGTAWVTIQNITNSIPTTATTKTYNATSSPALPVGLVQFRFTYTKSSGNLAFDDVAIIYGATSSFVPGYENLTVNGLSQNVTGLSANTPYYYRVRAAGSKSTSTNSNVITVTTTGSGTSVPAAYTVTGGGSYCSGGTGLAVGLAGSETGVTYTLYLNNVAQAPTVAGTGSAITFGLKTAAGTYTVQGSNSSGTTTMTGSVTITVNPVPTAYTVNGGGSYCSGGTGVAVGLSGSQAGVSYQLYTGATAVGSAVAGTGSAISFGLQTAAGTYTAYANKGSACELLMTGSATITVNALPVITISGSTTVNTGQSVTYSTQTGMTSYTWSVSGGSITALGTSTNRRATVLWGTTGGTGHVLVNYTNSNGCRAASAKDLSVIITKIASLIQSVEPSDSLAVSDIPAAQPNIYSYDKKVYVNLPSAGRVNIYNITGQLINTTQAIPGLNIIGVKVSGVYVVKVFTEGESVVKKVMIR